MDETSTSPSSWAELAAGSASARSVGALVDTPPAVLSGAELVDAIVASEKAMSLLAASQMRLLAEFAQPGRAGDVSGLVESLMDKGGLGRRSDGTVDLDVVEALTTDRAQHLAATGVAAALRLSPITAGLRVRKAVEMCEQLPDTVQALAAGRIDRGRAFLIAERTAVLSPELRAGVQDRVLPLAENRSTGNLRGLVDRAVIAADPAAAEEREKKAKRERELTLLPLPDGMASVKALAPAVGAASIYAVADLLAGRTGADDDRPVGARRVDAWVDIAEQLLTYGRVDLSGLLDDTDEPDNDDDGPDDAFDLDPESGAATGQGPGQHGPADFDDSAYPVDPADRDGSAVPDHSASDGANHGPRSGGCNSESAPDHSGDGTTEPATPDKHRDASTSTTASDTDIDHADSGDTDGDLPIRLPAAGGSSPDNPDSGTDLDAHAPGGGEPAETGVVPPAVATPTAGSPANPDAPSSPGPGRPPKSPVPSNPAAPPALTRWASRRSRLPHLVITMSASTWAGLDRLPAHLDGYGAITADTALALARSAKSITAALLDPKTGSVLGVGDRVYRPRRAVRNAVTTAAETCRFPSCRQPAVRCDLDHRDAFDHQHPEHGGPTCAGNLDPLCRAHHLLKHHTRWSSTPQDGYGREWVSPTGHHYFDPPRSFTLPDEQLTPVASLPAQQTMPAAGPGTDRREPAAGAPDDWDSRQPDRPDLCDAEFGGAFPDTMDLRVLRAVARRRLFALRDHRPSDRPSGSTPPGSPSQDRSRTMRRLPTTQRTEPDGDAPPF